MKKTIIRSVVSAAAFLINFQAEGMICENGIVLNKNVLANEIFLREQDWKLINTSELFLAVKDDYPFFRIKELAVEYIQSGGDINAVDPSGYSLLHHAAYHSDEDVLWYLLGLTGIDVNKKDLFGNTLLHKLIPCKQIEILKKLLDKFNVDVNAQDENGRTPLMDAAVSGNEEALKILIGHRETNLNIQDTEGNTALHLAAMMGRGDCYKVLSKSGIDPLIKNNEGKTAAEIE